VIGAANPRQHPVVLVGTDLDDTVDYDNLDSSDSRLLWKASRSAIVRRDAAQMAKAVTVPLKRCGRVLFVDKHFGPENARHRKPFEQFMRVLAERDGRLPEVELHIGANAERGFCESECQKRLAGSFSTELRIRVVRWNPGDLHNRFILTDCGGVAFLEGLDEFDGAGREEDVVVILDQDVSKQLLNDYEPSAGKLRFVDEFCFWGTGKGGN
jgi:hypothetical protein